MNTFLINRISIHNMMIYCCGALPHFTRLCAGSIQRYHHLVPHHHCTALQGPTRPAKNFIWQQKVSISRETSLTSNLTINNIKMSKTRKRGAEDGPSTADRKGKKRKGNMDKDESYDTELGINTTFARMDNQLLADHLLQKLTRFGSDLSPVEVSDLTISGEL